MLNDWENPAVQGRGRLPTHANVVPFADAAAALTSARADSILTHAQRHLALPPLPVPGRGTRDVTQPYYDDGTWTTIAVPGNWQLQGHDIPYYTDNQLPFPPDNLHRVPADDNPTAVYRCRFNLRRVGPAAGYGSSSTGSTQPFTPGSTAQPSALAKTAGCPPNLT